MLTLTKWQLRKMHECWELENFLDAYEIATNEQFTYYPSESPDFRVKGENGEPVGIELIGAVGNSEEILDEIYHALDRKNWDPAWKSKIIPLIQFKEYSLDSSNPRQLDGQQPEFADYNWMGIGLADYTGLEACGNIEIYGGHPAKYWGYHRRPNWNQKPYGRDGIHSHSLNAALKECWKRALLPGSISCEIIYEAAL